MITILKPRFSSCDEVNFLLSHTSASRTPLHHFNETSLFIKPIIISLVIFIVAFFQYKFLGVLVLCVTKCMAIEVYVVPIKGQLFYC